MLTLAEFINMAEFINIGRICSTPYLRICREKYSDKSQNGSNCDISPMCNATCIYVKVTYQLLRFLKLLYSNYIPYFIILFINLLF